MMLHFSSGRRGYEDFPKPEEEEEEEEEEEAAEVKCPIPKDVLLEMVREEAKRRRSQEFQTKVGEEEREGTTDGTKSIVAMQVLY